MVDTLPPINQVRTAEEQKAMNQMADEVMKRVGGNTEALLDKLLPESQAELEKVKAHLGNVAVGGQTQLSPSEELNQKIQTALSTGQDADNVPDAANVRFDPAQAKEAFFAIQALAKEGNAKIDDIREAARNVPDTTLQVYAAMVLRVLQGSSENKDSELEALNDEFGFLGQDAQLTQDEQFFQTYHGLYKVVYKDKQNPDQEDDENFRSLLTDAIKAADEAHEKQGLEQEAEEENTQDFDLDKYKKSEGKEDQFDYKKAAIKGGKVVIALALTCSPIPGGPLLALAFLLATQNFGKDDELKKEEEMKKEDEATVKRLMKQHSEMLDRVTSKKQEAIPTSDGPEEELSEEELPEEELEEQQEEDDLQPTPEQEEQHQKGKPTKINTRIASNTEQEIQQLEEQQRKLALSEEEIKERNQAQQVQKKGAELEVDEDGKECPIAETKKVVEQMQQEGGGLVHETENQDNNNQKIPSVDKSNQQGMNPS